MVLKSNFQRDGFVFVAINQLQYSKKELLWTAQTTKLSENILLSLTLQSSSLFLGEPLNPSIISGQIQDYAFFRVARKNT
jgi:hypothetical protein